MNINQISMVQLKKNPADADMLKEKKLRKACVDFEAIILKQMLTTMRKSIPKSELFGGGYSEEMYQSMSDDELSKQMAMKGTGMADMLYRQLTGEFKSSTK